jgi:hypothetical protein
MQVIIGHLSSPQHVSAVCGYVYVSSITQKLLHCIVCQNFISRVNAIFLDQN